ncbi:MAG: hypothetical protein GY720_02450 [bacterium]|nr:hypothetical protein [bacterium]
MRVFGPIRRRGLSDDIAGGLGSFLIEAGVVLAFIVIAIVMAALILAVV